MLQDEDGFAITRRDEEELDEVDELLDQEMMDQFESPEDEAGGESDRLLNHVESTVDDRLLDHLDSTVDAQNHVASSVDATPLPTIAEDDLSQTPTHTSQEESQDSAAEEKAVRLAQ